MASHMITMPLYVQFTLSYFAMSTTDVGPTGPFLQKMLRTTMDIFNSRIHNLFPGAPRHNSGEHRSRYRSSAVRLAFRMRCMGLGGNLKVVGSLAKVSRQAILAHSHSDPNLQGTNLQKNTPHHYINHSLGS